MSSDPQKQEVQGRDIIATILFQNRISLVSIEEKGITVVLYDGVTLFFEREPKPANTGSSSP